MTFGEILPQVVAAVVGALAGVLIMGAADHFTRYRSVWPRPICAQCGAARSLEGWIPLLGALLLARRCRECGQDGAWRRTVLVQVIVAVLTVALFRQYGVSTMLVAATLETYALTVVAVTDFQHRLIPTLVVYPAIAFALATSPIWPNLGLLDSLLGTALAFAIFFALAFAARAMFGPGSLGDGDVTLAALIGAICGYPMVIYALAMGALAGGVGAVLALVLRRTSLGTAIPYGPYLVIGVIYVLLTGNTVHALYTVV